jgi:hypothetical protein
LRGLADNVEHRLTALELQERDSKAAYERGRQDCDGRTPAELVRNFDLPTSIASAGAAAAAYAERKDETRSTDAAFKGCLDALRAAAEQAKEASATDGAEESPAATSSAYGQPDAEGNVRAPPEFIGEEAEYYRNEWIVCASMTPEEIARDPDVQIDISGLSQDEAATMLAQVVVGEGGLYPQAQFEGCRDGVLWGGR